MRFSEYKDFTDFCTKNNMSPQQGLSFLLNELLTDQEKN